MSYPTQPPLGILMPGIAYMSMTAPPAMIPAVMPVQHMLPVQITSAPQIRALPKLNANREQLKQIQGPPVTVFVGNITEKAPDAMIRHILATCGHVINWKRVKAFGFCEFAGSDGGLRAVRILHDMMVGDKRLVAKVDAKNKAVIDEYKANIRKKEKGERGSSCLQDELQDEEELDEETLAIDAIALERIKQILIENEEEMNNFEIKKEEEVLEKRNKILDEADVAEEKRDLITREIGKFREIMKKQEEEKEVTRRKEKERGEPKSSSRSPSPLRKRKKKQKRSRSRSRSRNNRSEKKKRERQPEREKHRERERELRDRDRERERKHEHERERGKDKDRDRDRDQERKHDDRDKNKSTRKLLKEKDLEEELKEKKEVERRNREKEASYQERLKAWETREKRKAKEYKKEREKERMKEEERERNARYMKQFLENYDDERDDFKFYKGDQLQRKLAERNKEAEADEKDRQEEKEEIEQLKAKIFSSGYKDPQAEFEKALKKREEMYKPELLNHWRQQERERKRQVKRQHDRERDRNKEIGRELTRQQVKDGRESYIVQQAAKELAAMQAQAIVSGSDVRNHYSLPPPSPEPKTSSEDHYESVKWTQVRAADYDFRQSIFSSNEKQPAPPTGTGIKLTLSKPSGLNSPQRNHAKKQKADLREVFNPDEDDTSTLVKKRELVPLDINEDKKNKKGKENEEKKSGDISKSQEEKRKQIKSLIESIPTKKCDLFAYQLDRSVCDNALIEKRIRPWINKKIIEYIGEPEPTLVDFICSKVLAGCQPQIILEDVQMILDEEAEVFVVKMWRLLIYEVEAKKLGLIK